MVTAQGVRRVFREFWLNHVGGSYLLPQRARAAVLRVGGIRLGDVGILARQRFIAGNNVHIGDGSFINNGCLFDAEGPIRIGTNVAVGPDCRFLTGGHDIDRSPTYRAGKVFLAPITIGSGSWIGACVVILPGVSIGEGCVVAAGAVVTRNCDPHGLYAGVPARRVRDLPIG